MISIERAKYLIRSNSRTLAPILISLASLAAITVPANAGLVIPTGLNFNSAPCTETVTGGTQTGGSCTVGQLSAQNGIVGGTLSGIATATATGGLPLSITFSATGTASGTTFIGEQFPVSYDILFSDTDGHALSDLLTVTFQTTSGAVPAPVASGTISLTSDMGSLISGKMITIPAIFTLTGYTVTFTVTDLTATAGAVLTANVVQGASIDFGGTAVPEPATISLVGSVVAGLMFWRRRTVVTGAKR